MTKHQVKFTRIEKVMSRNASQKAEVCKKDLVVTGIVLHHTVTDHGPHKLCHRLRLLLMRILHLLYSFCHSRTLFGDRLKDPGLHLAFFVELVPLLFCCWSSPFLTLPSQLLACNCNISNIVCFRISFFRGGGGESSAELDRLDVFAAEEELDPVDREPA